MRSDLHTAYILHQRRYRETSLILECLSAEYGRVGIVAKGAAAPGRRGGNRIQAFQRCKIAWTGRGDLRTLTHHEPDGAPVHLAGERLFSGFYANELVIRLVGRDDPNVEVFANYAQTLDALAQDNEAVEPILRRFEKSMLDACGYGLQLSVDAESGAPVESGRDYYYVVEQGPMHAHDGGRGIMVRGATLLALDGRGEFLAPQLREAKRLMRFVLHHYIGDRPLASRALFKGPGSPDTPQ